jgi:YcxB-like protein
MHERGPDLLGIKIEKIELGEYKEASWAIARKLNPMPFAAYAIWLFTFFLIGVWLANRDLVAVVVLATYLVAMLIYFRWLRSRQLREAGERGNRDLPVQLTFTENGVLGKTRTGETFRTWEGYEGYFETENTFVLAPTYRYYSVIPKRVIDDGSLPRVRELLRHLRRL